MLGMLPAMAVPNKEDIGVDLTLLGTLLTPLGCALTLPAYLYGMNVVSWTTILGAYCFKRQWRTPTKSSRSWYTRIMVLTLCGSLYLSMWSSYLYFNAEVVHNGDKIKLREAVANFLTSPAVQEFSRNLHLLWQHMLQNGFWSSWSQLVDSLDPFGEKNALTVLGLAKGATQEEIRSKYRELSKVHHPDKVKGSQEEREAAQEMFVKIQEAYEKLSDLKRSRAKANKKQQQDRYEPADAEK